MDAVPAERLDRRLLRFANEIEGTGKQHGDRACLRHRGCPSFVGVLEMVCGQRREFRGKRSTAEVGELVGMQLDRQPEPTRRLEYPCGLLGRKRDALHEGIDSVGEP